jgi:hypothetical protein
VVIHSARIMNSQSHLIRCFALGSVLAAAVAACGQTDAVREITLTRPVTPSTAAADPAAASAERFGFDRTDTPGAAAPVETPFAWDLPAGWAERTPTQFRLVNLALETHPDAECYVTMAGGGAEANINRWRGQMGQPPLSSEVIDGLPRITVLGREAVYVEIEGAYTGMGGTVAKDDYLLLGAIMPLGADAIFVKMTGPRPVMEEERERFEQFCTSLRIGEAPQTAAAPSSGGHSHAEHEQAEGLAWTAPETWSPGEPRPMRVATYRIGGATECYITRLMGDGGGIEANINRWRGQMDLPPLAPAEFGTLPQIEMLGRPAALAEMTGTYTDMAGNVLEDAMMLAALVMLPDSAVFVRMTGPEAEVRAERGRFIAFCQSLHEHGSH